MIVHVTQKHIDEGIQLNCCKCPIALALQETTDVEWIVSGSHMCYKKKPGFFSFGGWSDDIETPVDVGNKIVIFDVNGTMEPFSFTLENFS